MNTAVLESWTRVETGQPVEEATLAMHLGEGPQRLGFGRREGGFGLSVRQGGLSGRAVDGNGTSVLLHGSGAPAGRSGFHSLLLGEGGLGSQGKSRGRELMPILPPGLWPVRCILAKDGGPRASKPGWGRADFLPQILQEKPLMRSQSDRRLGFYW